ncbi:MAG: HNH endonuclease [Lachnospiraceae bacterium]|nr:HNH endonuclease [Lachnospiraceae bacterium]
MISIEQILDDDFIAEYKKAVLLSIFKKIIIRTNKDDKYRKRVSNLFKQTYNRVTTVKLIVQQDFDCELSDEEAKLMDTWFRANQSKQNRRKPISKEEKVYLKNIQNGKCLSCGCDLGEDTSKIHVDHIIPWMLVGDELPDNYQALCETCNECKSSRTDYMIAKKLKLI